MLRIPTRRQFKLTHYRTPASADNTCSGECENVSDVSQNQPRLHGHRFESPVFDGVHNVTSLHFICECLAFYVVR